MYETIAKDLYRIHVPLPGNPLKELNVFLIKGADRNLLIDTGFRQEECRAALEGALADLDVRMEDTDILLTHLHSDHTGLAPDLAAPSTKVYLMPEEQQWLVAGRKEPWEQQEVEMYRQAGMSEEMLSYLYESHPGYALAPDPAFDRYTDLEEGMILEAGDYRLEVIRTPGHTPGNLCLWAEEQQILFSSDHVLFDITPHIQRWINIDNSLGRYLESLRKIREYPAKIVLPAHRETGPLRERVDEILAHHEYRLGECLQVIREEGGLCAYDITGRMTWRIRARNWAEFPLEQKWFAVGECLSHLDYLMAEEKIRHEEREGVRYFYAVD